MNKKPYFLISVFMLVLSLTACVPEATVPTAPPSPTLASVTTPTTPVEQPVIHIPLDGPIAKRKAEVSGMAWYGEYLILLPQYPSRLGDALFALPKAAIIAYLEGHREAALEPQALAFDDDNVGKGIKNFQGYEALAFVGERVFLSIESGRDADMVGYLIVGDIAPDLSALTLNAAHITPIEAQSTLDNTTDESLFIVGETVVTLYEENGAGINAAPVAHRFYFDLTPLDALAFPTIEFRITDVTELSAGQFWGINYFYPGDKAHAPTDPIADNYGQGATHSQNAWVERLVLFDYAASGITLVNQPPIQLELSDAARNWEGLVRLDERGFLLVTDTYPETMLGFVALP